IWLASVSGDALKTLAGKVSAEYDFVNDEQPDDNIESASENEVSEEQKTTVDEDKSAYGIAFQAFEKEEDGREACHAISALCEVCSIDSLISNFILPLQGSNISGKNGRIHCSLNINTETGRLSARRPNLQGSAADVAMCAMLEISKNARLKELGWKLLLQVHDEVILEGPTESAEVAKAIVVECMSKPFNGKNILQVDLSVDAKCAQNWYSANISNLQVVEDACGASVALNSCDEGPL
ncbi:dna polymerase i b, partial [Quercus suber]